MASFNVNDYEDVASRITRLYTEYPDARIVTINHTTPADRSVLTWVVEARIYLSAGDQSLDLVKGTGWAFEIDGQGGMANKTSALENAETSAIGRAVSHALAGYSGDKKATRTEMAKVKAGVTPTAPRNWLKEANGMTVDQLRILWAEAQAAKAPADVLEAIKEKASGTRDSASQLPGTTGSPTGGTQKRKSAQSQTI